MEASGADWEDERAEPTERVDMGLLDGTEGMEDMANVR